MEQLGHQVTGIPRVILGQINQLTAFFEEEKPDYIFHLAAYGNMSNQKDEQAIFEANVIGTWNMLQASKHIPYKVFVNVGSSSEYGRKSQPMSEIDVPETDTFYGASKIAGTYLARAFARQYNKPIVTVRPFSVYGPKEADFRFIPTMINCIENKKVFHVDPHGVHDWIYIDDLINGMLFLVESGFIKGEIYNIGTGLQTRNIDVLALMVAITGKIVETLRDDFMRLHDSFTWRADVTKMGLLGWKPKISLREGLTKTYEWYRKQRTQEKNN